MSSIYFSSNHRSTNSREKARLTNGLPSYSAAVQEKLYRHGRSSSWLVPISAPIPGIRNRRFRLWVPNPARIHQGSVARFGRKRGTLLLCFGVFLFVFITFAVHKRFTSSSKQWPKFPTGDPPTLVFTRTDLQRIWKWEIESGHYPSRQKSTDSFSFHSSFPLVADLTSFAFFSLPWSLSPSRIDSSRNDRVLVRDLESSPPAAENRSTATKAAAHLEVGHEHERYRSQAGLSRYSITGFRKSAPISSRIRKHSGFGCHHETLRFLDEPGNVSFRFSSLPFPPYGRERLARGLLSGAVPLFCIFGRLTHSFFLV